jgi:hypothetical protein
MDATIRLTESADNADAGMRGFVKQSDEPLWAMPRWNRRGPRPIGVKVGAFSHDVIDAAAREREITFTTYGRKTGKPSDVTILVVTDRKRLFILSGQGMARHWPQNLVVRGEGILHLGGIDVKVKSRHVTDPAEARTIFELYGTKYGTRFAAPKPDDSPRPSEQATFELIPAAS